jgi:CBS domain-containing protein
MLVKQIMTSSPITIDKDLPLTDAIDLMQHHEISRLIVLDAGGLVGILTERNIARKLCSTSSYRLLPSRMRVSSVMTANPVTVAPNASAKEAAGLMLDRNISGLPVVDRGTLTGIVTKMDFAKVCLEFGDIFAGQIMQPNPVTASPGNRVIHARRLLLDEGLIGLPVVEGDETVGIVTVRDLAMRMAAFQKIVPDKHKGARIRHLLIGDIMTQPPVCTRTDAKLSEVARIMLDNRFSSLPVLDLEDRLVGLITKTELTKVAYERL